MAAPRYFYANAPKLHRTSIDRQIQISQIRNSPISAWDALHNPREDVIARIGRGRKASFCSQ